MDISFLLRLIIGSPRLVLSTRLKYITVVDIVFNRYDNIDGDMHMPVHLSSISRHNNTNLFLPAGTVARHRRKSLASSIKLIADHENDQMQELGPNTRGFDSRVTKVFQLPLSHHTTYVIIGPSSRPL